MDRNAYAEEARRLVAGQTWMRADEASQAYLAGLIAAGLERAHRNGRDELAAEMGAAK